MPIKLVPVVRNEDNAETASVKSKVEAMHGLSMLGLDTKYLGKSPNRFAFPNKFHPDSRKQWDSLFADKEFKSTLKTCRDPVEQWHITIRRFISKCRDSGCDPFATSTSAVNDTTLYRYLSSARARICKVIDNLRILEVIKLSGVERRYTRRENDFDLRVSAKATGYGTLENLVGYLAKSGFRNSKGVYSLTVDASSRIFVDTSKPANIIFGYEVKVGAGFKHPKEGKTKLKPKNYDDYITKNVWLPIVRNTQFNTLKKKTLF